MPWGLISLVLFLMLAVTGVFAAYTYLGLILSETAGANFVSIGLFVFGALALPWRRAPSIAACCAAACIPPRYFSSLRF